MITIVDYGMGNLGSILNMFKRIGVKAEITSDIGVIARSSKLLLPGVGAFDAAMQRINEGGFREVLDKKATKERIPVLGICLGMQLLGKSSEEGEIPGLGWIDAIARRFPKNSDLKVPHMGWNVVMPATKSPLTTDMVADSRFYFVHSYYVNVDNEDDSILKAHYGLDFDAGITTFQPI